MELTVDDFLKMRRVDILNWGLLKSTILKGVSTDSRSVRPGEVFFALRGERFDGHQFVDVAIAAGAALCVVDDPGTVSGSHPTVVVKDTTKALGELATIHRSKFTIPVLAIGGSNGKTTTKEMVAAVLASRYRVLRTEKNYNNHIGVPMTLFGLTRTHEAAVVEIGTNHPGEIAGLCRILQPTHGLVTNVGREHLEFFRTVRRVATEEGALYEYLRRSGHGTALVNADDPWVLSRARGIRDAWKYGFGARGLTVRGTILETDARGCVHFRFAHRKARRGTTVRMAVPGAHSALNALAAATAGLALGVPATGIREALGSFRAVKDRMQIIRSAGVVIINDAYNANPDSMMAALRTLATMNTRGKRIAVLGDMREMGHASEREHRNLGREVARLGVEYLLTFGAQARHIHDGANMEMKFHYDQKNMLAEYLLELVSPGDLVLVKGSRGMRMEDVITFLQNRLGALAGKTIEQIGA